MDERDHEYSDMLLLEDLESLLEDLEDARAGNNLDESNLPPDLSSRVLLYNLHTLHELRERIAAQHSKLDRSDSDERWLGN
jgi:hypothetical protein